MPCCHADRLGAVEDDIKGSVRCGMVHAQMSDSVGGGEDGTQKWVAQSSMRHFVAFVAVLLHGIFEPCGLCCSKKGQRDITTSVALVVYNKFDVAEAKWGGVGLGRRGYRFTRAA